MNILMAASEGTPFIKSGGLADVVGSLSKSLVSQGHDCRVVLPLYQSIKEKYQEKLEFIDSVTVKLGWRNQYCGIFTTLENGVRYYFLDNEYYFNRDNIYGYFDDGERFAFYAKAVLDTALCINFQPDILHCNDWQTALCPVFLDTFYKNKNKLNDMHTVFTIHNIQYQGQYSEAIVTDVLGLEGTDKDIVMYDGCVNYMKGGIQCAYTVNTVSPQYATEILDPWFGHGLDKFLRGNRFKLSGILNGIDYDIFDPNTDKNIYKNYNKSSVKNKLVNKSMLQKETGLTENPDAMLIGIVSRLVEHKGIDLIEEIFENLISKNFQFVILGSGDKRYEDFFADMSYKYPKSVFVCNDFNDPLSRKIYAGADVFLMPSKSEPCGLSQMIALRYGTLSIVRLTGGLMDSVCDFGEDSSLSNGYTFYDYNPLELLNAIERAAIDFVDKPLWQQHILKAMSCDFSWDQSSKQYIDLYEKTLLK